MHPLDAITMKHFPTLCVPKYREIDPIEDRKTRLLMSEDGLYIESKPAWGHIMLPLWINSRTQPLPYGNLEPSIQCPDLPISKEIRSNIRESAHNHCPSEYAGAMYWNGSNYRLIEHHASARGAGHVTYHPPEPDPGETLFLDIHSHGEGRAFFSSTDDQDDQGGVRMSMVLGKCGSMDTFEFVVRLCVEGYFFPCAMIPQLRDIIMGKGTAIDFPKTKNNRNSI